MLRADASLRPASSSAPEGAEERKRREEKPGEDKGPRPANTNRPGKRNKEELEFLPSALEILETPASPMARGVALTLALFFTIAVAWATIGQIDIVAAANGKIVPVSGVMSIQPVEIGNVRAIHVRDGQEVRTGDVLVEVDPTEMEVDKGQVVRELLVARVEAERIRATLRAMDGQQPAFEPPAEAEPVLVEMHRQRLRSEILATEARIDALKSEYARRVADRLAIKAQIEKLTRTIPLVAERDSALKGLSDRGNAPRRDWLAVRQAHIEQMQDLEIQTHRLSEVEAAMVALEKQQHKEIADVRRQLLTDLMQAQDDAETAALSLRKMAQRAERQTLRAPVDGLVQQLQVHTIGGVVTPAQVLMVVVPKEAPVEIEALVLNKDKGFVEAGQEAEIKIESFPFTKYGTIGGKVLHLSGDSIQNEDLGQVYAARVAMSATTIAADGRHLRLVPGMAVTVEIKTGKRRVIEYLLAPLLRYQDESLRER